MAGYSDDDIKNAAEIREWLTKLIFEKQNEIERIKITLSLIDSVLKQGSFKTAANLNLNKKPFTDEKSTSIYDESKKETNNPSFKKGNGESSQLLETRQIKRMKDNTLIAQVEVSKEKIEIIPSESFSFNMDTPPFKSFFINRILEGMKNKDIDKVKQGQLSEMDVISFNTIQKENNDNILKKIEIKNYRDKDRINEIFNTVAWVFTRMLEKSER
jgi:ribosomal protein L11